MNLNNNLLAQEQPNSRPAFTLQRMLPRTLHRVPTNCPAITQIQIAHAIPTDFHILTTSLALAASRRRTHLRPNPRPRHAITQLASLIQSPYLHRAFVQLIPS